ncbi:MAG: AAA family ATPase [Gammaproteobacteria bacterium]|nr:MAG: AAA family ATPase [Gammaproteobacteria bacterium]
MASVLIEEQNDVVQQVIDTVGQVILGKQRQIKLATACLLARGHLLIEDLPGVGKTTMAHALAQALGLEFQRIQFTSDLLPADILGVSIFERDNGRFVFHPGPVFANVVLADEINRATPKTQSALLEAMEEYQVTIESETRSLPEPFFVIATQNPAHLIGTFPLPESQLDRFLMRIELGFPDKNAERALLKGNDRRDLIRTMQPALDTSMLLIVQASVRKVFVSDALIDYLQALLEYTRSAPQFELGLSPRAGLSLMHGAQAWAMMEGRSSVLPEDIQAVLPSVVSHRLKPDTQFSDMSSDELVKLLVDSVPVA